MYNKSSNAIVKTARAILLALPLWAQTPVKIEYKCTPEDVHAFGLSCTAEEPCQVFLEIAAVDAAGDKIFVAGNLHTASATLYSILLASSDSGATWTEPVARIPHASLDQIQLLGFDAGWVAGQLIHPLPRDPFLLITADGGNTWKQRAVVEDGRSGAIEQFVFENKTSGSLVIRGGGRWELYETQTGGDSWSPKEIKSTPIRLKQEKRELPLRVRADAAARMHRLERRTGDAWQTIVSFPIQIGLCRPAETP